MGADGLSYALAIRAPSSAHLRRDDRLMADWTNARACVQSEFAGEADGFPYPVTLRVQMRGHVGSLADAEAQFAAQTARLLPIISVAGNAAVDIPKVVHTVGLDLATEPQPIVVYESELTTRCSALSGA